MRLSAFDLKDAALPVPPSASPKAGLVQLFLNIFAGCLGMQGRDVHVIGAANVGKSAFVRALMQEMGSMGSRHFDAAAAEHRRWLPVESPMPGTTLGPIPLHAFASGGILFGTPHYEIL